MAFNFHGLPPIGIGPVGPMSSLSGTQSFIDLTSQGFSTLRPSITIPGINDNPLEFNVNKNQSLIIRNNLEDHERRGEKSESRRDRDRDRDSRRTRIDRDRKDRDRRDDRSDRDRRDERRPSERESIVLSTNNSHIPTTSQVVSASTNTVTNAGALRSPLDTPQGVWGMGIGYPVMGVGPMGSVGQLMGEMPLGPHLGHAHGYGPLGMGIIPHENSIIGPHILSPEQIISETTSQIMSGGLPPVAPQGTKEIIHCKSCTLFPPNPNAPPPTTRERPSGCRTVFVGGLPENITENVIQEIFERCGEITTLRLSKKNFCHVRFLIESSVDSAIYFSGYRVRIGSNGDSSNTGRLHVDFAQARDDQYEWECRQRQLQREQRHRERVEKERQRPPSSPPPVIHFTDHEASNVCEKIKQDDTFMKAVQVVITWLERGDCTKRNANTFYSMIQSTNSHVRRLLTEKATYEEELQKAKELLKGRMQGLLIQFSQIERVFTAASHKKVWDHFTKAQRKNIEMWKKQSLEIKAVQLEEAVIEGEGEMEVSDSEDEYPRKKSRTQPMHTEDSERLQVLKDENDSLRCQLEAYKNEVDLLKSEIKIENDAKEKQIKMLHQTLKGMQEQLTQSKKQQTQDDQKIKDLTNKLFASKKTKNEESEVITLDKDDEVDDDEPKFEPTFLASSTIHITQKDAKLIGLISTFLHIHPFGSTVDYLYFYLQKLEPMLKKNEVEPLMQRFPKVFSESICNIGASTEKHWHFIGLNYNQNR